LGFFKNILEVSVTDDIDPSDRWHMNMVEVDIEQLEKLSKVMKSEKYYAHFWNEDKNIIVVFRDKIFNFNQGDESGSREAIDYGLSVNIPEEQLDFLTE
jgi:hypothetical protein